ncbi:MAG: hypothetical protein OHK0021_05310 [Bryobacter sp.]
MALWLDDKYAIATHGATSNKKFFFSGEWKVEGATRIQFTDFPLHQGSYGYSCTDCSVRTSLGNYWLEGDPQATDSEIDFDKGEYFQKVK